MKHLKLFTAVTALGLMVACTTAEEESVTEKSTTSTTTITTTTNDDGTIINVDKDGFEIGKKDGGSETKVKVTTDSVRIKMK